MVISPLGISTLSPGPSTSFRCIVERWGTRIGSKLHMQKKSAVGSLILLICVSAYGYRAMSIKEGQDIESVTDATFQTEILAAPKPTVVYFYKEDDSNSMQVVNNLQHKIPATVYKCDLDKNPISQKKYNLGEATVVVFERGQLLGSIPKGTPDLKENVERILESPPVIKAKQNQ